MRDDRLAGTGPAAPSPRRRRPALLPGAALLIAGCGAALPASGSVSAAAPTGRSSPSGVDPFALAASIESLGGHDLWPGFDPRAVPLAIWDGERTLLFGHPSPPADFRAVPGRSGVFAAPGRHPAMTANSSADIGGRATATVLAADPSALPATLVGIAAHEKFHVFQRARHPGWSANEVELFTYPVTDTAALALRRLEWEALRRALESRGDADAACWSALAMSLRLDRFAGLAPGAVEWERHSELNEGLAAYVGARAVGTPDAELMPAGEYRPEDVRSRAYISGAAMARLLDRLEPTWRDRVERRDTGDVATPLDSLLLDAATARALGSEPRAPCALAAETRAATARAVARDVAELRQRLARERAAVLARAGWRLVFVAQGEPLFPQGFDPLNVRVVGPGEVVHTRWLKLGNRGGSVEVLDAAALTEAAGAHPLFNGVRAVTVTGLGSEPVVAREGDLLVIRAKGLTAELRGAVVTEREGGTVVLLAP